MSRSPALAADSGFVKDRRQVRRVSEVVTIGSAAGSLAEGGFMRVVTIDGPAGSGKSTVAKRLAEELGWRMLDTGAMYRAVTLAALREGVDLLDDQALSVMAAAISIEMPPGRVLLDNEDVSLAIRTAEVARATSAVADRPGVRRRLVELQREFAREIDVVTEGRDQGTIVFPDALRKYFLTASLEERACRRLAEFLAKGEETTIEAVRQDVRVRDDRDAARAIAPMLPAPDAIVIDTTGLSLDAVVAMIVGEIHQALGTRPRGVAL